MVQVYALHEFEVIRDGRPLNAEELHREGERLMEALLDLEAASENLSDVATSTDAEHGLVTAEMIVTADSAGEAFELSDTIARTAIHTIGGATPDWGKRLMMLTAPINERRYLANRVEMQPA